MPKRGGRHVSQWRRLADCRRVHRGRERQELRSAGAGKGADRGAAAPGFACRLQGRSLDALGSVSVRACSRPASTSVSRICPRLKVRRVDSLLQQMVAVAELEAGMISARTKAALAAAKKRGTKLGGNRGVKPTAKMRARSTAVLQQRADARAADIGPTVKALQAAGATTLRAIAAKLSEAGIPTPRGNGQWSAVQVQRT